MKFVLFYHSIISDWHHGTAHFLRGIVTDLQSRGHEVEVYEPINAWSVQNLLGDHGAKPLDEFLFTFPHLRPNRYTLADLDLEEALDEADVVLVHEWNDRELVGRIGEHRARARSYQLLFHDTHHRAATAAEEMSEYDLSNYDGVLAYGSGIRDLYLQHGWAASAWTWHEAADTRVFHPRPHAEPDGDVVWVGNWGDHERTSALHEFLISPIVDMKLRARVFGPRYPEDVVQSLRDANITYGGWLPNWKVPEVFARHRLTVHVPRRQSVDALRGIPTIRPFEAMACAIPLICSPWEDSDGLFTAGEDYLVARSGREMRELMHQVTTDPALARSLAAHGLDTINNRHTCSHRVAELLQIVASLRGTSEPLITLN